MIWSVFFMVLFSIRNGYKLSIQSFTCIQIGEVRLVGLLLAVYRRVGSEIKVRSSEIDAVVIPTGRNTVFGTPMNDKVYFSYLYSKLIEMKAQ